MLCYKIRFFGSYATTVVPFSDGHPDYAATL